MIIRYDILIVTLMSSRCVSVIGRFSLPLWIFKESYIPYIEVTQPDDTSLLDS